MLLLIWGDFMTYENLLDEAYKEDIYVMENAPFESKSDGLINGDVIGINRKVHSNKKRACVLAEELGHYHTTVGDILDQNKAENRKQELHARVWAYNKLIGLRGIVNSYTHGCRTAHETADYLEVTEEFLTDAVQHYRNKYGVCATLDNYVIYFEPTIAVFELI